MYAFREYAELFWVFFRIGAVTFGGGLAMLPILERDLVIARKWLTADQLVDYFAIGQSTPGIIAVNVATFVGYNKKGIKGGIVTTAGVVTPSVIIITILAMFLENFADILWVQRALRGINVVVAVLLVTAVVRLGKRTVVDLATFAVALAAFAAMVFLNASGVVIVIVSGLLGLALRWRPGKSDRGASGPDGNPAPGSGADGAQPDLAARIGEVDE